MAKKRKKRKSTRKKARRNPSPIVRYKSRPKSNPTAGQIIGGVHMKQAATNVMPMFLGALTAKFFAKKFADGGSETENWTWKNYAMGLGGTLVAGLVTSALFGGKKKTAQRMFEGGLLICAYKLFTNDIATKNETLSSWFSGTEGLGAYDPSGGYGAEDIDWSGVGAKEDSLWGDESDDYVGADEGDYVGDYGEMGDLMQTDDGKFYAMGPDEEWGDVEEGDRVMGGTTITPTGVLVTPDATMGGLDAIHPDYGVGDYYGGAGSGPIVDSTATMGEVGDDSDAFAKSYGGGLI